MQNYYSHKKVKLIAGVLFLSLFCAGLASAAPQVFFSYLNLTITNCSSYHLWGEGLDASESFSGNYEKYQIPITFSREIYPNQTDTAVLINALAGNLNISGKWEECVIQLSQKSADLDVCNEDRGYKQNYTDCQTNFAQCVANVNALNEKVNSLTEENKNLKTQRIVLLIFAIICGIVAFVYYGKINLKKVAASPYGSLPDGVHKT